MPCQGIRASSARVTAPAPPLMLLDAASLYFRAFYGVPDTITAPDGTPVNAVRGFTDMVARLVTEHRPTRLVACLDLDWRPAFRVKALPSYKAHRVPGRAGDRAGRGARGGARQARPAGPGAARACWPRPGSPPRGAEGYEADDVIGTLAAAERTDPVLAVSAATATSCRSCATSRCRCGCSTSGAGWPRPSSLGPAEVAAKYGVPAARAGRGVRRDGDAARRPVRRAARRARHRREDRGHAGRAGSARGWSCARP